MKLIALRDFRNVAQLRLKDGDDSIVKDAVHDDHVHKGAVFEIGKEQSLEALRKKDLPSAQIVAHLIASGAVGDASDNKLVEKVGTEIAVEKKRLANAAKLDKQAAMAHLGEQVVSAVEK